MKSFLLGVGIGTVVGLLTASQAGEKTRAELGQKARNWFNQQPDWQKEQPAKDEAAAESEAVAEVLNTAKRDDLMSVPGIGKATAKRIIKNRPYETEEEVVEEGVLPEKTLERVKEQLVPRDDEIAS